MACVFYAKVKETNSIYETQNYIRNRELQIGDYDIKENDNENNICLIHKMNEDISTRVDNLTNEIQTLKTYHQITVLDHQNKMETLESRIDVLEGKNQEVYMNHILGQCISNNLVDRINNLEFQNYNEWYNIPDNILHKYGFTKEKLNLLRKPRNLQCHPYVTIKNVQDVIGYYGYDNQDVKDLVLFIYDPYSQTFR